MSIDITQMMHGGTVYSLPKPTSNFLMLRKIWYIPKNCLGNGIIKEIIVVASSNSPNFHSDKIYLVIQLSEKFSPSRLKMELIFFRHTNFIPRKL